ncbi:hypothetical protein CAC42_2080 [Sphaceloma murrayae]|uniref:Uncharacterized protein n=1 Tax=Sphaceloma murrayae TaxID=2082308 RepID=A0A2K1QIT2_9PEZI|nr:hypothetical protein CAC42_2080 [Sphaceloma murrayae]
MKLPASLALVTYLAGAAFGQRTFDVRTTAQLRFEPASITGAQPGDRVRIIFGQIPHNIISSSFENPCQPINGSNIVNSGTLFGPNVFEFTVSSSDPTWYYCSVGRHCSVGPMVFGINPTAAQSLQSVEQRAVNNTILNATAAAGTGGVVVRGNATNGTTPNATTPLPPAFTGGAPQHTEWWPLGSVVALSWVGLLL